MKRYIIFLASLICSCTPVKEEKKNQDELFKESGKEVLKEISAMEKADQDIRMAYLYGSADLHTKDSIIQWHISRGLNTDSIEVVNGTFLPAGRVLDSISALMAGLDKTHTQKVIALIDKYGYPTSERLGDSSNPVSPILLLHHADASYKDTLLSLMDYELKNKRIDKNTYEDIKWHLNGRIGIPDLEGVTIIKMDKETGEADTIRK